MTHPPLTLKETILVLRDYLLELLRKWYWFVLFGALAVLVAAYYTQRLQTTYEAVGSVMLSNDSGSSMSGILRLAGQFGLGGGGNSGDMNIERLGDLLMSQQIAYLSLFKKAEIDGKKDLLINHYIRLFKLDNPPITAESSSKMTLQENATAKGIYNAIAKKSMHTVINKSGILYVSLNTTSEKFSKEFLEIHLKTLENYYTNRSIEQQKLTYDLINERVDSLEKALYNVEYNIAHFVDEYRPALRAGTLSAQKLMSQDQLKRQAEIISVMYAEAVKNREIAHLSLLSNRPLVQIVDLPNYPLSSQKPSMLVVYITYLVLATIVVVVLVVFNKLVRDAFKPTP
jgi:uncharacterized protein involved in exopolysaccharide biosynthesis